MLEDVVAVMVELQLFDHRLDWIGLDSVDWIDWIGLFWIDVDWIDLTTIILYEVI